MEQPTLDRLLAPVWTAKHLLNSTTGGLEEMMRQEEVLAAQMRDLAVLFPEANGFDPAVRHGYEDGARFIEMHRMLLVSGRGLHEVRRVGEADYLCSMKQRVLSALSSLEATLRNWYVDRQQKGGAA